jgi:hypothetical protein
MASPFSSVPFSISQFFLSKFWRQNAKKKKPFRLMQLLEENDADYRRGSIRRMRLRNFVTYEYADFEPGPRLNVVIGMKKRRKQKSEFI